jgi:hypothetical protein
MRRMGFSKKWDKLQQPEFTTFRFARRDKDWYVGEQVQIVLKPRRKGGGEKLGIAEIINKRYNAQADVTNAEAVEDGFNDVRDMEQWLIKTYGRARVNYEPINKLTLKWIKEQP